MPKSKLPVAKQATKQSNVPMPANAGRSNDERRWKAEDALRTLQRAEQCKADKALMKDVQKLATEQIKALKTYGKV